MMIENTDNHKQTILAVLAAVTGLILIFIVPDQVMLPVNIAFAEFHQNASAINSAHSLSLGLLQVLDPLLSALVMIAGAALVLLALPVYYVRGDRRPSKVQDLRRGASRLGRSTFKLLGLTEELQERVVEFVSLKDQIDTTRAIGKAMFRMLAVLAGLVWDQDDIVVADLDLAAVIEARFDFDVCGHYARPDVFSLLVNEQPGKDTAPGHL